jgi:hypothetical protein
MIVGRTLDYYIIYVLLLKVTTKGKGIVYNSKKKQKNKKNEKIYNNNKNVDKFGFVASLI